MHFFEVDVQNQRLVDQAMNGCVHATLTAEGGFEGTKKTVLALSSFYFEQMALWSLVCFFFLLLLALNRCSEHLCVGGLLVRWVPRLPERGGNRRPEAEKRDVLSNHGATADGIARGDMQPCCWKSG